MKQQTTILIILLFLAGHQVVSAQPEGVDNLEYWNVVKGRAEKIVKTLEIDNEEKAMRVRDLIAMQYYSLSGIHDGRDEEILATKKAHDNKDVEKLVGEIEKKSEKEIKKLHKNYLKQLSGELTVKQVDLVKDGMTYGVLPLTYNAYLDLLPDLTDVQKDKIMEWLIEAREIAMDAGSSEKKHYWFGKYKGKINNYLSDEGYDLKKAEKTRYKK